MLTFCELVLRAAMNDDSGDQQPPTAAEWWTYDPMAQSDSMAEPSEPYVWKAPEPPDPQIEIDRLWALVVSSAGG